MGIGSSGILLPVFVAVAVWVCGGIAVVVGIKAVLVFPEIRHVVAIRIPQQTGLPQVAVGAEGNLENVCAFVGERGLPGGCAVGKDRLAIPGPATAGQGSRCNLDLAIANEGDAGRTVFVDDDCWGLGVKRVTEHGVGHKVGAIYAKMANGGGGAIDDVHPVEGVESDPCPFILHGIGNKRFCLPSRHTAEYMA